jgi:tryptophanyl-tRNA synthetase
MAKFRDFARENAKDLIAIGFNPERTFIYTNSDYMGPATYANSKRVLSVSTPPDALTMIQSHAD